MNKEIIACQRVGIRAALKTMIMKIVEQAQHFS